jgi:hypothetical protein
MSGWTRCEHCGHQYNESKQGHSCWQSHVNELRGRIEELEKAEGQPKKGKVEGYDWDRS